MAGMFKKVLTDPKEHNSNDFIYLVHGVVDWDGNGITPYEMRDKVKRIRDKNQFYRASMIAHLNGESAKNYVGLHDKVYQIGTFGSVGLIVNPADDGLIQIAWNCDIGSPWEPEKLKKFVNEHKGKIRNPHTLLTQAKGDVGGEYNELILKGDENTDIQGVFYKDKDSKTEQKSRTLGEIASEIMQSELPVIVLPHTPVKNYDDIKDPKERKMMRTLDNLDTQNEVMQAHLEFYRPELFRDRDTTHQEFYRPELFRDRDIFSKIKKYKL